MNETDLIRRNIFLLAAVFIFIVFLTAFWIGITSFPTLIVVVALGASVAVMVFAVASFLKSTLEFGKWDSQETHPLLYKRTCKNVLILDEKGSAIVEYRFNCLRTYGAPLKQVVHQVYHDGKLTLGEVKVDSVTLKPKEVEEFVVKKRRDGEEELAPQPYHLKMKILFPSEIARRSEFSYGYVLDYKEVYPRMTEKGIEFSSHTILIPTRWLKMRIAIQEGVNLRFVDEGITFSVVDKHEVEDVAEEERVRKEFSPKIAAGNREITWEIHKPKISSQYKLFFLVKKQGKS